MRRSTRFAASTSPKSLPLAPWPSAPRTSRYHATYVVADRPREGAGPGSTCRFRSPFGRGASPISHRWLRARWGRRGVRGPVHRPQCTGRDRLRGPRRCGPTYLHHRATSHRGDVTSPPGEWRLPLLRRAHEDVSVCVDLSAAAHEGAGLGRYAAALAEALLARGRSPDRVRQRPEGIASRAAAQRTANTHRSPASQTLATAGSRVILRRALDGPRLRGRRAVPRDRASSPKAHEGPKRVHASRHRIPSVS